jgi:hypothetical protein
MFVMAEKYGIPKVFHPPQNIFANPNYGYYELYICESSRHNLSSGCVHEMSKYSIITAQTIIKWYDNCILKVK